MLQIGRREFTGNFLVGEGAAWYDKKKAPRQAAERRKASEDSYVQLARKTVETYVRTGKKLRVPEGLPEEMYSRRAGVFVSLKEEGRLRGRVSL